MQAVTTTGITGPDGNLTLSIPLGRPNAEFDAVIVLQPRSATGTPPTPSADPLAAVNAVRRRLAASGRVFTDSAELVREDRDR